MSEQNIMPEQIKEILLPDTEDKVHYCVCATGNGLDELTNRLLTVFQSERAKWAEEEADWLEPIIDDIQLMRNEIRSDWNDPRSQLNGIQSDIKTIKSHIAALHKQAGLEERHGE